MAFCTSCGSPLPENVRFCSNCGTKLPEQAASQPPVQEAAPVSQPVYEQPAYEQPIYQQPQYQAPQYTYQQPQEAPAEQPKKSSLAAPILSLCFALTAFLLGYIFGQHTLSGGVVLNVIRFLFAIPAFVLGIVGLVKSCKGKNIAGIILSSLGLILVLYTLYIIIRFLSLVSRFGYWY